VFQEVSAFRALVDAGNSVADISARFGVSDNIVNCRLALARVSPVLWKLYEEEDLSLGVLQAFTLTDDHATQERIWNDLPEWDRDKPNVIRRILLKEEIPATDRRVRFVGLDSYEAAGGFVRRDLFSEGEDGAYVADPELLTRLVNDKLQTLATAATAEGWKWVNVQPQIDHQALGKFRRIQPTPVPLPKKDAAKLEISKPSKINSKSNWRPRRNPTRKPMHSMTSSKPWKRKSKPSKPSRRPPTTATP
jgi:ParB family chromosome partitioning protein